MKKLKVGVIGVGHLGRLHASIYTQIPEAELIGVFDTDVHRCNEVAAEFNTKAFSNPDELISRVQGMSIVVPTTFHHEVATNVLNSGVHCLIEKPITSTIEEANDLIKTAEAKNAIIQIGHIERFNPAIVALNGIDLDPMFVESHRLASFNPRGTDVAVVLDLMIHDIDIILSLVKSPVRQIDASGVAVITNEVDIANARIQFENGAVANVTASRISQKKMRKMRLFQKNAYISIDFLQKFSEIYRLVDSDSKEGAAFGIPVEFGDNQQGRKIIYEKPPVEEGNALKMELASFIEAIKTNSEPAVSGEQGKEALRVAIEITQMIKEQLQTLGIE
ncbi:gfo/Idh/MocA family oxidoreductase [candidate division KSB1 bacterium]|nr:gfo/Idh/MocA family oxidoreductase [candidate division KSB1 bacterium]